jgi:hypothetical protein
MQSLTSQILKQISSSSGKNLFCRKNTALCFTEQTESFLLENRLRLQTLSKKEENTLVAFTTKKALEKFYETNQYYAFSSQHVQKLQLLYVELFRRCKSCYPGRLEKLAADHYSNLRSWLRESNPFAETFYGSLPYLEKMVVCAEYSFQTQLSVLGIHLGSLKEPILDLGCGKYAALVHALRARGFDAYGIDRMAVSAPYLTQIDWFDFALAPNSWGTIISHLGFSNQFHHHHVRNDGRFVAYAQKYRDILDSLKCGGSFFYAPDLPFIEGYVDGKRFNVYKQIICGLSQRSTNIQRIH